MSFSWLLFRAFLWQFNGYQPAATGKPQKLENHIGFQFEYIPFGSSMKRLRVLSNENYMKIR